MEYAIVIDCLLFGLGTAFFGFIAFDDWKQEKREMEAKVREVREYKKVA